MRNKSGSHSRIAFAAINDCKDANSSNKERLIENFKDFAFSRFGLVLLIAVILMISGIFIKVILRDSNISFGISLIFSTVFTGLIIFFVSFIEFVKEKKAGINPALTSELTEAKDTGKLLEEKTFEPVQSVTENSTELLLVENKTQKIK